MNTPQQITTHAQMQAFLDAMKAELTANNAEAGQMTLGELHAELAKMPPRAEVLIQLRPGADKWGWLGEIDSYRGYYKDAMLETDGHPGSVAGFLTTIELAIGEYFTGYKGGEYYFDESTPVWADEYSLASGHMVTGVELRGDGKVYITTTQEEF